MSKVFDSNGDGKVSAEELGEILTKQGKNKLTTEEVDDMISSVDMVLSNFGKMALPS